MLRVSFGSYAINPTLRQLAKLRLMTCCPQASLTSMRPIAHPRSEGLVMRQTQDEPESFRPDQVLPFVSSTLAGRKTDQEIIEGLPHVFGELHETVGAYAIASQMANLCNAQITWLRHSRCSTSASKQSDAPRMSPHVGSSVSKLRSGRT